MINELEKWNWEIIEEEKNYIHLKVKNGTTNVRIWQYGNVEIDIEKRHNGWYEFDAMELIALGKMAMKWKQEHKAIRCKSCEENENITIFEYLEE